MKTINKVNYGNAAKSRNMLDYSALFVKLLHEKIRTALHKIKDICLDERENYFVILRNLRKEKERTALIPVTRHKKCYQF